MDDGATGVESDRPDDGAVQAASTGPRKVHAVGFALVVSGVAVLILVVVLPTSFKGVEYDQFAFVRRKASGRVNTDTVFTGGRYPIGMTYDFKAFPADAHFLELRDLRVFASDRLEVSVDCALEYFLRIEDLKLLHEDYDVGYEGVLRDSARDAIKTAATKFSTREYGTDRARIEGALFEAVRTKLGGICCPTWCDVPGGNCSAAPACIPRESEACGPGQLGLSASVRFFQLLYVALDGGVLGRNLKTLTQLEDAERELFVQAYQLEVIETKKMVDAIDNAAAELSQNATAQADLIRARATAAAQATIEGAHSWGLTSMYGRVNVTTEEQKASLNYLRTLRDQEDVHLNINFESLVNTDGFR